MKRYLSIFLCLVMAMGLLSGAVWAAKGELVIVVPEGYSIDLSSGTSAGTTITPSSVETENGMVSSTYTGLTPGAYHMAGKGSAYYPLSQNLWYSEEEAETGLVYPVVLDRKEIGFYNFNTSLKLYSQEVIDKYFPSDKALWPEYAHVFDTPWFTEEHIYHSQTSQESMMAFLRGNDGADDNLYLYDMGSSPALGYESPIVVLTKTDLASAGTLEEAASLVRSNEKPTVFYEAMVHGNEPAAGEAALAMIDSLDEDYGEAILEKINVVIIPRINIDGATAFKRANSRDNADMNKDHLALQTAEMARVHHAYILFMPEIVIDAHEYDPDDFESATGYLNDIGFGICHNTNSEPEVAALEKTVLENLLTDVAEAGLRPGIYGTNFSSITAARARTFYGYYGSLSFIMESRGMAMGLRWFERRVLSHYVATESVLNYAAEHSEELRSTIAAGREAIVEKGKVYDEDDQFTLGHKTDKESDNYITVTQPLVNKVSGEVLDAESQTIVYSHNTAVFSRPRPTAYVIPKGERWAEKVVESLQKNGIDCEELPAGEAYLLQQYLGHAKSASLAEEAEVIFEEGAFVFPMDQTGANILSMAMEPDIMDGSDEIATSLVQSGMIRPRKGVIPIYRCIRDLKEDGTIPTAAEILAPEAPDTPAHSDPGTPAVPPVEAPLAEKSAFPVWTWAVIGAVILGAAALILLKKKKA